MSMKSIGGYFELEVTGKGKQYHDTPYRIKNGRSALHFILAAMKPALVHMPYYSCSSLLEPFAVSGCKYQFYEVDAALEPLSLPDLQPNEYFLYINYFGLKDQMASRLSVKYKDKLILDCTQAFFMKGNCVSWYFNSCRKFFGVPDGAYLYIPAGTNLKPPTGRNERYVTEHLTKRLEGHTSEGYPFFLQNEELMDCEITGISAFSERLLSGINYNEVIERRLANYTTLHNKLCHINQYTALLTDGCVPMCYPLLLMNETADAVKRKLNNIFIPTFWGEVIERSSTGYEAEKNIAEKLLPLPIDHRYSTSDMEYLAASLNNIL